VSGNVEVAWKSFHAAALDMFSGSSIPTRFQGVLGMSLQETPAEQPKYGWMTSKSITMLQSLWQKIFHLESKFHSKSKIFQIESFFCACQILFLFQFSTIPFIYYSKPFLHSNFMRLLFYNSSVDRKIRKLSFMNFTWSFL